MLIFFKRLDKYMKYKGLNDNKITIEANISNGLIGKARKRGSLSQENISKILHTYNDLDARWLLTGAGEMLNADALVYKKEEKVLQYISESEVEYKTEAKGCIQRVKELEENIAILKQNLELKDYKINNLEKEIKLLKKEINRFNSNKDITISRSIEAMNDKKRK
jgi:DNA-binding transcriptional regulator YiaG